MDKTIEDMAVVMLRQGDVNHWTFERLRAECAHTRDYILDTALCEARDFLQTPDHPFGKKKMGIARRNIARSIRTGALTD